MHNLCRYAVIFAEGRLVMFELPSSMHLSKCKPDLTDIRPALSSDYTTVGDRTRELATRWAQGIYDSLTESGVENEKIAIDRIDLEMTLAIQKLGIELIDGKPIMGRARSIKSIDEIETLQWSLETCEASVDEKVCMI